ncbi:Serine/threonine-protein phosphatase 4 regulatory subunit 1, partial [Haplosporangium sp. Z 767]
LGLYFGEEDEEQLVQEDKALSYLVLANDQDDAFDPVDTENLLAQMSSGPLITHGMELDEETDVVQLLAEPSLSAVEKIQLLSQSQYDFHRSFLAREMITLLPHMETQQAITHLIPTIRDFSLDAMDSVRECLATQLDKIILYFLKNTVIDRNIKEPVSMESYSQDCDNNKALQEHEHPGPPPTLPHGTFTPVFMNLLLDQNAGIAHQTRLAIVTVAENIPEEVMESEILNGVIAGLEKLYNPYGGDDLDLDQENEEELFSSNRDEQDGEAELGKMLVVVLLTSLARVLGPERCTRIVIPRLEKFMNYSQFYVRKEIVMALGALCKIVSQEVVVERLLPIYDLFVQDDTWHIRRACCTVLASFISSLPVEMKAKKVEEIYDAFSVDVSRSVQNSIMEVLGEVIAGFEREQVPDSLLTYFLDMGQHPMNEHERAVMCAFSFPAVILTAGRSKWELMKPVYMRLAGTFRSPIRRSLACSLHEVARILGPELADRDLAMAFSDCLVAEDEVREGVLGHVADFIACLSPKCRSEAIRGLENVWNDLEQSSNWRLRDSLTAQLAGLCDIADGDDILKSLFPLSVKACTDSVSTIRESGVMTFPALWEASTRLGAVSHVSEVAQEPLLKDEDTPVLMVKNQDPLEDVEMEDVSGDLNDQSCNGEVAGVPEQQQQSPLLTQESSDIASVQANLGPSPMNPLKEKIISQTKDFAIHGGFRSRVVAVQIIQSLLDQGISSEDFETHFLPLLTERLSKDSVVNIRIWVARVVTWILDSGYYGDKPVCLELQELHWALQQDPDRDVRIYSGGPMELPKPQLKPRLAKKAKNSRKGKKKTRATSTVFHQNPKDGQVDRVDSNCEQDTEETEVRLLFERREECEDGDEDRDEDGDEDEDEEEQEDESSDENSEEDPQIVAMPNGTANEPQDRVPLSFGMKITLESDSDEDHDHESDDDEDDDHHIPEQRDDQDDKGEETDSSTNTLVNGSLSEAGDHMSDVSRKSAKDMEHSDEGKVEDKDEEEEEDDDDDDDDVVADRVVPYTTLTAKGASPLDVEMEESSEDEMDHRPGKDEGPHEPDVSSSSPSDAIEPNGPSAAAFPPLSSTSPISTVSTAAWHTPLSYAALVKIGDEQKTRALLSNTSTLVSFSQANIPEPPCPALMSKKDAVAEERVVLRILDTSRTTPSKQTRGFQGLLTEPLSPSFPSLSSMSSSSSSSPSSLSATTMRSPMVTVPTASLPFSYASVVASGAVAAAAAAASSSSRAFSPPMSSTIPTNSATLTC